MKRRAGITIQLVVARTNSPTGVRNGTRRHWKWKRSRSRNTKKVTSVSIRKSAICPSISALPQLIAELGAATAGGLACLHDLSRRLFLFEPLERRRGGAALRSDRPAEPAGRVRRLRGKLRRAEHHQHRQFQGGLPRSRR